MATRSLEQRLTEAARQCAAMQAALADEIELRDRLILEAVDVPHRWDEVSEWTGLSHARIGQIIARRG